MLWRFLLIRAYVRFLVLLSSQQTVLPWWGERWHRLAFVLFLVCWVIALFVRRNDPYAAWTTELVVSAALVAALVTLGREQPLQNVIIVAAVFAVASCLWNFLIQRPLTWRFVSVWMVVLFLARGSARYLLQNARASARYGWWLAIVAGVVAGTFTMILYRGSGPGGRPGSAIVVVSAILSTMALIIASLPLLMNKRPVEPPVSWESIAITALLATSLWFGWV